MTCIPYLVRLCLFGWVRSMKGGDNCILLEAHPQTITLDHTTACSYQQCLNTSPLKRS